MHGFEIGRQPEFLEDDNDLVNLDPERVRGSPKGSDLEDEDDEINWTHGMNGIMTVDRCPRMLSSSTEESDSHFDLRT